MCLSLYGILHDNMKGADRSNKTDDICKRLDRLHSKILLHSFEWSVGRTQDQRLANMLLPYMVEKSGFDTSTSAHTAKCKESVMDPEKEKSRHETGHESIPFKKSPRAKPPCDFFFRFGSLSRIGRQSEPAVCSPSSTQVVSERPPVATQVRCYTIGVPL